MFTERLESLTAFYSSPVQRGILWRPSPPFQQIGLEINASYSRRSTSNIRVLFRVGRTRIPRPEPLSFRLVLGKMPSVYENFLKGAVEGHLCIACSEGADVIFPL